MYYRINPLMKDKEFLKNNNFKGRASRTSSANQRARRMSINPNQNISMDNIAAMTNYGRIEIDTPELDLNFLNTPKDLREYASICLWTRSEISRQAG